MLKKLRIEDVDNIMQFWKEEMLKSNISKKSQIITNEYTNIRELFINNNSDTTIYTEDGEIEGFICVDNKNKINGILVKEEIRREGIGRILLESVKKDHTTLSISINKKNIVARKFLISMGFYETDSDKETTNNFKSTYEWKKEALKEASLIYFDNDIEKSFVKGNTNVNYNKISIKPFIKDKYLEENDIKTYLEIRKQIESAMDNQNILLYIDYNNYYDILDDQIKEIAKIKKVNLNVIICEPFTIENSKKMNNIKAIEKSYKDYKIHKIDFSIELDKNININQIFNKRLELLIEKIEKIAENM